MNTTSDRRYDAACKVMEEGLGMTLKWLHPRIAVNAARDAKFRQYIRDEEDPGAIAAAKRGIGEFWYHIQEREEALVEFRIAEYLEEEAAKRSEEPQDLNDLHEERDEERRDLPAMHADYYAHRPGTPEHREAYRQYCLEAGGPGAEKTWEDEYEADNYAELQLERYLDQMEAADAAEFPEEDSGIIDLTQPDDPETWARYQEWGRQEAIEETQTLEWLAEQAGRDAMRSRPDRDEIGD